MSRKSKGSAVLAMVLFLGSAPTWAAPVGGRAFGDSDATSTFSAAVTGWLDSFLQAGHATVKGLWAEYGIAIDPDGTPSDPSHRVIETGGGAGATR